MPGWNHRTFELSRTWGGDLLPASERASLTAAWDPCGRVALFWEAPWPHGPQPRQPPGSCANLWEYPVIELFLADAAGCYIELEFGPAGHWLAIYLQSYRVKSEYLQAVEYRWWRWGERWCGRAEVRSGKSHHWSLGNVFLISRDGMGRRYAAAAGAPGTTPDFHRHDCYLNL